MTTAELWAEYLAAAPSPDADFVEQVARTICTAEGVDPDHPCPGIGNIIPVGETWPAWKVRERQARAVLALIRGTP